MIKSRPHKSTVTEQAEFFSEIRRTAVIAMFSDDVLFQKLVLKGGNALSLVYEVGKRASLDLDFSIDGDFEDLQDLRERVTRALISSFDSMGYVAFDINLRRRPESSNQNATWGGYLVEFKLIDKSQHDHFKADIENLRKNASPIWSQQQKTFTIELSKYEYCVGKQAVDLGDFTIYVYSLEMIALEKLRAICQQMPGYTQRKHPAPRARDFYDIYSICHEKNINLHTPENLALMIQVFAAKEVPFDFLLQIPSTREFHRPDWPAVMASAPNLALQDYDRHFDFVLELARYLHAARKE